MAINPTTPGVYIQEISTLPPSVAPVATAVPGFVGYTEKGTKNKPMRITSMLEFEESFGGAHAEAYQVTNLGASNMAVAAVSSLSVYSLYYHMQFYFGNGGGPCWVVSVGDYSGGSISLTDFVDPSNASKGFGALSQVDEVTLLVAPEIADSATSTEYGAILKQCSDLQDRFAILDVKDTGVMSTDLSAFRSATGLQYLNYAAAYYPYLKSTLVRRYNPEQVTIVASVAYAQPYNHISFLKTGKGAYCLVDCSALAASTSITLTITVNTVVHNIVITTGLTGYTDAQLASATVAAINGKASLFAEVTAAVDSGNSDKFFVTARYKNTTLLVASSDTEYVEGLIVTTGIGDANISLYNDVLKLIEDKKLTLKPSAAIAGIYASVDRDRGVWKAPANVSVNMVIAPTTLLTHDDQGLMNVDATSGKSINAIRPFTGKGTLVWGARTLAGNDNEWRYINVRRLFIFAEESIKKASSFVVFEPNDRNTWNRVKGTIENFLTNLWRDGALVGATPKEAFFVNVGLGETMTAQDILEGKMIVQVGMAASRPAEFIILQFQHKMQES